MPDLEPTFNDAQKQYVERERWDVVVSQGWLDLADYAACTWCGSMVYPAFKDLHRVKCQGPLDALIPVVVPTEVVQMFELKSSLQIEGTESEVES